MTDEQTSVGRLAEIRARLDAIIPGPWRWYGNTAADQVYLATRDRGRLIILTPGVRTTEYVYHHERGEGYGRSSISNTQVRDWCGAHDEFGGDDDKECICADIAYFLQGEMLPEDGYREFDQRGVHLTRGVQPWADLRFPVTIPAPDGVDADAHRKQHGGFLRSYRDRMPRYEVLGYRTISEWEMDQGGVMDAREALYREDFTGLDNPEADFIQHSAEDVKFLLEHIGRLEADLRLWESSYHAAYACPECGSKVDIHDAEAL